MNNNYLRYLVVVIVLITLLTIYYKYYKYWSKRLLKKFTDPVSGKENVVIDTRKIYKDEKTNKKNSGLGWTLSFWVYINDWNYRYRNKKNIVQWENNCYIALTEKINNLIIEVPIYSISKEFEIEKIYFNSIPLQKWININVILDGRNLDLYINGKLYNSRYLSNVPLQSTDAKMQICPDGGFDGHLSRLKLYNYAIPKSSIMPIIFRNNIIYLFKEGPFGTKNAFLKRIFDFWARIKASVKIDVDLDVDFKKELGISSDEDSENDTEGKKEKEDNDYY